jgi:ATP-dependent DNA helicase RecG
VDADVTSTLDAVRAGRRPSELESMTLDFKTVGRSIGDTLKDLAEAAACFANAEGGKIIDESTSSPSRG